MNSTYVERKIISRPLGWLLSALLIVPIITSCGGGGSRTSVPAPVDDTTGRTVSNVPANGQPQAKKGLSTGQKLAILGGAAALFYLYQKNKNKQGEGAQGKYYLSKDGRVYYRDAEHRAHYVSPPAGGIQVPEAEAQQYRDFQGYNNSSTGRSLTGIGSAAGQ